MISCLSVVFFQKIPEGDGCAIIMVVLSFIPFGWFVMAFWTTLFWQPTIVSKGGGGGDGGKRPEGRHPKNSPFVATV